MKKKIIIIGGGISGLVAGIYAAKAGFQTELYEQHSIVGGECTGWDRDGYHIDNCIHWMIGTKEGTELYQLWKTVGAIEKNTKIIHRNCMYTSERKGQSLSLWQDINRTEDEMIKISPEDKKEIQDLMKFCRMAQNIQIPARVPPECMGIKESIQMLTTMRSMMKISQKYKKMNVQDLIDRFQHPLIKCLISDFTPKDSKAASFPMAYGNFISGDGGIPKGGSRAMAFRMRDKLLYYGGKIFTGKEADKIIIEGSKAVKIQLKDGQEIGCDYIIPACDASVTFGKLLPQSYMESLMQEMFTNRRVYPVYSTFQVAFGVDSSEHIMENEIILDSPELVFTEGMQERITIKSYQYEPSFAPRGKQIIQTLQGGSEHVFEFWTKLYENPESYQRKKQELAKLTMEKLEERFPKIKGKITVLDTWTPMTYKRYCSAFKGFYQSVMLSKESAKMPYPSAYIKGLNNVILAGQWINPPGGLPGSAIAGKFAVQRIIKKERCKSERK